MTRPTYAEIDLGAIRHNCRMLRSRLAPGVKLLGIVKADAYGHGAAPVARALAEAGIDMLGVAMVEEARHLRTRGLTLPILVMGAAHGDDVPDAIQYGLTLTVADVADADEIDCRAAEAGRTVPVHLKVDTGMNRLGVRAEDAVEVARHVAGLKHVSLEGLYTHLACADCDPDEASAEQLARFQTVRSGLEAAGIRPPLVHAANSAAVLRLPHAHFNMVRAGLALYGVPPCPGAADALLRPALALRTCVTHVKRVRAGEGVSYGHRWKAQRDSLLGLLPVGYADGYPRALWRCGRVRAGGRLVPIAGTICMDSTLVDLTDVPEARVGLPATLIEADADSPLSAWEIARLCGTIPYEILTGLAKRVPRVYR